VTTPEDIDFARQIRAELADPAPQGFAFTDQMARQDSALQALIERLHEHPDPAEVARAVALALADERDGWTLLKLIEIAERLNSKLTAEALMRVVSDPPGDEQRARFLAGRACEVLLKLPLDYETRLRANELSKGPLEDAFRARLGAQRERQLQRPRRLEWLILIAVMVTALLGFAIAWTALDR
jgi:hypothetical protein